MAKRWMVACALLALGCGSGSGSSSVYGDWLRSTGAFVVGVTFETDGTYSVRTMQIVSSTEVNQQLETGAVVFEPGAFTLTPSMWTCPEHSEESHYRYSVDGDTLLVSGTAYERNDAAPNAGIVVTLGCFDEDGAFTKHPLTGE